MLVIISLVPGLVPDWFLIMSRDSSVGIAPG